MANSPKIRRTTGPVQLGTLPPDTSLWHVMPDTTKFRTFLTGGFWFARLDQFGPLDETLEGHLPTSNLGLLQSKLPGVHVPEAQAQYALGVQRTYASCWHVNDQAPSDHAWRTFGRGGGVAIRTDVKTLRAAVAAISGDDGPVYIAPVEYINHDADFIQDGNVIAAAFAIRDDYRQEQEVRALIYTHGTAADDHLLHKQGPQGALVTTVSRHGVTELQGGHRAGRAILIGIDPKQFIHEIVIQPGAGRLRRCKIAWLVRWHGLSNRLRH